MGLNFLWNALIFVNIYILLGLANNLTIGYSGVLNLACAAQFAIGSYSVAILMTRLGLGFLPSIGVAVAISGILTLFIGLATLRYKRTSFALVSLAFHFLILSFLKNSEWAGSVYGIRDIPPLLNLSLRAYWILTLFIVVIIAGLLKFMQDSPWGLSLQALRDDEMAATSRGHHTTWLKIEAFLISSAIIVVAGGLFATHVRFIDPSSFTLDESIFLLLALICGGTCNLKGPILGAIFAVLLPEGLRFLEVPDPVAANVRNIVFAIAVILLMRFRPRGLAGRYAFD